MDTVRRWTWRPFSCTAIGSRNAALLGFPPPQPGSLADLGPEEDCPVWGTPRGKLPFVIGLAAKFASSASDPIPVILVPAFGPQKLPFLQSRTI